MRKDNQIAVYGLLLGDKGPRLILLQIVDNNSHENHIEIARRFHTGTFEAIALQYSDTGLVAYTATNFER